jgi:hypothetical protein
MANIRQTLKRNIRFFRQVSVELREDLLGELPAKLQENAWRIIDRAGQLTSLTTEALEALEGKATAN